VFSSFLPFFLLSALKTIFIFENFKLIQK
jgi:hypothetical protein